MHPHHNRGAKETPKLEEEKEPNPKTFILGSFWECRCVFFLLPL